MSRAIDMDDVAMMERVLGGAIVTVPLLVYILVQLWRRHTAMADRWLEMQGQAIKAMHRSSEVAERSLNAEERNTAVMERYANVMERQSEAIDRLTAAIENGRR